MTLAGLKSATLSAFLVGTARRRPDSGAWDRVGTDDPKADLKAAALLAQALRLERPGAPDRYDDLPPLAGRRRPLPESLRAPFLRLFGAGKLAVPPQDPLAAGMALTLERLFLAPHPYDFHHLEPFLRAHADHLGADAQAWLDRDRPAEARPSFFDIQALSDETWTEAAPARRQRYIAERRLVDPAAARGLVEAVWAQEGADLRLRLLGALRPGLGGEDRPFLDSLAGDRAPKVRELAARLMSFLPGPDGERPAHRETLGRIGRATAGFLRKRTVLSLELPATVPKDAWRAWVVQAFREIDIEACVGRLGLPAEEIPAAAADDQPLLAAVTLMAARSGRLDLLATLARTSGLPLMLLAAGAFADDTEMPRARALALAEALVPSGASWSLAALRPALAQIHALAQGPVGDALFDRLMAEADRQGAAEGSPEPADILAHLALLAPASRRGAVSARAAGLGTAGSVLAWLHLVEHLEKAPAHE